MQQKRKLINHEKIITLWILNRLWSNNHSVPHCLIKVLSAKETNLIQANIIQERLDNAQLY